MKKADKKAILESLRRTHKNNTVRYKEILKEVEAIECEPDCLAQFDETVLVSDYKNNLHLRHFKELKGEKFECFGSGLSSNETEATTAWKYMKRCLIFEPYTGVRPELKEGDVVLIHDKDNNLEIRSYTDPFLWNNVADYCIYKLPKS